MVQLELEIDMILEKTGVISEALQNWSSKWVPVILEYASSLSGRKAAMVADIRKNCEGTFVFYCCMGIVWGSLW